MPQRGEEFTKYFKNFDWKAKGVVRKRFEVVDRHRYLKKGFNISDFKQKLQDLKQSLKALEEVSGKKLNDFRALIDDQQTKYNFFAKPVNYYKDFFLVTNTSQDQLDVRRMPPYYTHRKISDSLDNLCQDLLREKERKFRTSLQDHILFAIICDGHKFNKNKKNLAEKLVTKNNGDPDLAEIEVQDQIDWGEVKNIAEVEEEVKEDKKKAPARDDPYGKDLPFADN